MDDERTAMPVRRSRVKSMQQAPTVQPLSASALSALRGTKPKQVAPNSKESRPGLQSSSLSRLAPSKSNLNPTDVDTSAQSQLV